MLLVFYRALVLIVFCADTLVTYRALLHIHSVTHLCHLGLTLAGQVIIFSPIQAVDLNKTLLNCNSLSDRLWKVVMLSVLTVVFSFSSVDLDL